MVRPRGFRLKLPLRCSFCSGVAYSSPVTLWLRLARPPLVRDDGPAKADIAVVLAGDSDGHRIDQSRRTGARRLRARGAGERPPSATTAYECDLAIPFAVHQGYPADWFIPCRTRLTPPRKRPRILPELRAARCPQLPAGHQRLPHRPRRAHFPATAREAGRRISEIRTVAAPDQYLPRRLLVAQPRRPEDHLRRVGENPGHRPGYVSHVGIARAPSASTCGATAGAWRWACSAWSSKIWPRPPSR